MKTPSPSPKRHNLPLPNTLDDAPFLTGTLSPTGVAELEIPDTLLNDNGQHYKERKSDGANNPSADSVGQGHAELLKDLGQESEDIEDYDEQELDTSAIIESHAENSRLSDNTIEDIAHLARVPSIPVKLVKTEKSGRYLLAAEDPDIRDILRKGLERDSQGTSFTRTQGAGFRDLVFTRRFTTFDRSDPARLVSPFRGFFTLFWIGTGILIVRVAALNWRHYGNIFGPNEIMKMMFGRDLMVMALTDGFMCASTVVTFLMQLLVSKQHLDWNRSGWILQQIWQTLYIGCAVGWTFYREWPWTHTIFIVLHSFVFLMKQHSYAAYNGYLSQVYARKLALEKKMRQLAQISPVASPNSSRTQLPVTSVTSGREGEALLEGGIKARKRRASTKKQSRSKPLPNLARESSEIASVVETISSARSLGADEFNYIQETIDHELDAIDTELRGKCNITKNYYPNNLTFAKFMEWSCLPTLVYELEYPRQDHIKWSYVAEKTGATFGVLAIMQVISQAYIYPLVIETVRMKEAGLNVQDRWQEFPWIILDMVFPLMLEQLLSWYLIWECVLNVIAELTCFADRGFYGDWWNSVSFADYARDWNKPVHVFLLRHVYHSSISALHVSKTTAMIFTFLLSACVHELVMFCLFHKIRGYLFLMQLLQLPLAALSRTKLLKDRKVFGNIVFWFGIFVGPSIIMCLYLIV